MFIWAALAFYCLAVAAPLLLLLQCHHNRKTKTHSKSLPPGPPGWPVVGNLLDIGYKPQETFLKLQQKYGAVFMLRLGAVNTVVITSADAATELFKKHDLGFCNRHLIEVLKMGEDYNSATVTRPVGPYWRMVRRLYATEFFSRATVKNTEGSRRKCVQQMIQWVSAEGKESTSVELRHLLFVSLFNLMGNLLFSRDLLDLKSADGNEFYRTIGEIVEITIKPNAADFFPWLRKLDLQNLNKRMKNATDTLLNIIDGFAKERRRQMDSVHKKDEAKDFWTVLQEFEGNGKDEPRKMSDRQINLLMIVNRFLGTDIDYRGQHFGLIPFGSGRRICPGLPMAHQVLHMMLGSLLKSFDWALESGVTPETIDMGEALGITLRKSIPLKVIALANH
ncbi:hypothetical protein MKX01_020911 [Papaver californicum]|nr:hypothetical protein MKX01_020911 [Papaver californicum]